jgi:ribA/ribD-fused uncharacterized protein
MSPQSVAELIDLAGTGSKVKYLHFWGHRPQRDGSPGPGCLSQWWPAPFRVEGQSFATAEHYMMWRKAALFGDIEIAENVLTAAHPHQAKSLGSQVRGFDQTVWEAERYAIVVAGSIAKFSEHDELKAFLLTTGARVLVEASPVDRIWGIGLAATDPGADDPARVAGCLPRGSVPPVALVPAPAAVDGLRIRGQLTSGRPSGHRADLRWRYRRR